MFAYGQLSDRWVSRGPYPDGRVGLVPWGTSCRSLGTGFAHLHDGADYQIRFEPWRWRSGALVYQKTRSQAPHDLSLRFIVDLLTLKWAAK